jgi:hypothetical protein
MRRFVQPFLAVACLVSCSRLAQAQLFLAATMQGQTATTCATSLSSFDNRPSGPEVKIAELNFEGDLRIPNADLEQIATSLKQQKYSGDQDAVTSDVLERVRLAWQNQGYFKVEARG